LLVVVAERGGGKALLSHGHEGSSVTVLERELDPDEKARSVEASLGAGQNEAVGAFDHLEHVRCR
jgi:hypothetical protein